MAGKKGNKAHANKTSFTSESRKGLPAYEKWTEEEVFELLYKMMQNAESDKNILCLTDAIRSVDLYDSSLNYLLKKFPKFEDYKSDLQKLIISRINKNALLGDFNPTASIWRMKQLGEKDEKYLDHTTKGNALGVNVTPEEAKEINESLENDF